MSGSTKTQASIVRAKRFPKDRYQTEVESWRELQLQNIEFTLKRLREPVEGGGERGTD
jgi:hypothetical protein